jgi:hypothetical protein
VKWTVRVTGRDRLAGGERQSLTSSFRTRVTDDVFRVGVNYRFGAPVIAARY